MNIKPQFCCLTQYHRRAPLASRPEPAWVLGPSLSQPGTAKPSRYRVLLETARDSKYSPPYLRDVQTQDVKMSPHPVLHLVGSYDTQGPQVNLFFPQKPTVVGNPPSLHGVVLGGLFKIFDRRLSSHHQVMLEMDQGTHN